MNNCPHGPRAGLLIPARRPAPGPRPLADRTGAAAAARGRDGAPFGHHRRLRRRRGRVADREAAAYRVPAAGQEPRWNEVVIDDTAPSIQRAGTVGPDGETVRADVDPTEALAGGLGCSLIVLAFLLVGPVLLYFYFSGAQTRRGNPVMGLVVGILFTAVGFLGVLALGSMRRKSGRKWGRNDPRRLP